MSKINDLDTPACSSISTASRPIWRARRPMPTPMAIQLRPHIKTHKLPRFAQRAVELGAVGITVQKLGEAEIMADAGLTNIFLPYNIVGPAKLARLKALNARVVLAVTADSPDTVAGYARDVSRRPSRSRCWSSAIRAAGAAVCNRRSRRWRSRGRSRWRRACASAG